MYDEIGNFMQPPRAVSERLERRMSFQAFFGRHGARSFEAIHRRERDLPLRGILTRRLPQSLRRLFHVQNVVDNLKREAYVLAVVR